MQLKRMMGLLVTSLSISSFMIVGCEQERDFNAQAQPSTQTQEQPTTTPTAQQSPIAQPVNRTPDVPFVPTPNEVVEKMLELASVTGDDVLYDLGSGDGRIVITAAQKYGTRGTGIEINPALVEKSRENAEQAGVSDRTEFRQQDLFETDLSNATVVTLYLLPDINLKLRPQLLRQLRPGTRIVSHDFNMGDWEPERTVQVQGPIRQHTLYYWVVPEKVPANLQ